MIYTCTNEANYSEKKKHCSELSVALIRKALGHADYFNTLHSYPIFIKLTYGIPVVSLDFQSEWK